MRPLQLIIIGALVAFEVAVVGMIAFPQVDPRYRAVYMDRTSECWPHPVSGAIVPGEEISFVEAHKDGTAKSVLRCGWLDAEKTGTLSVGPESRLLLQLAPNRSATLDIDLLPIGASQRVEVTGNGLPLTTWTLSPASGRQNLAIPATDDGVMEIAFHFPDAIAPRDLGLADDRRKLAIRLLAMTLRMD